MKSSNSNDPDANSNRIEGSELALWRYSIIAPLLHPMPGFSITAQAREIAAQVKHGPDGAPVLVSIETILRWLRAYQRGGLEALDNKERADTGCSRALDDATVALLLDLSSAHPTWTIKAIHAEAQKQLGRAISLKAVYRVLRGHGRPYEPEDAARRRPVGVPQVLWLADTMHGVSIFGDHRKKHKSYLITIMDDASRAIMASQFTLRDDVTALIPVFRQAILARGLPHRLLVDNGPNYRSRVLRAACAKLGIHLVYAQPYRATAKARLERFFLTVRLQMIPKLPPFPTLADIQAAWARFVAEYHATPHRTLGEITGKPTSPLDYYLTNLTQDVRQVPEMALEDLFQIEETRRVNPDATIRIATKVFEVRPQLAGAHVVVRFNPSNVSRVLYRPAGDPKAAFEEAFLID